MSAQIATFATIFFSMILVNNYVLVQFLGICPFLGVSKKLDSSLGMGLAVIVVMVIATAVTFPLQIFLLDAYGLGYMQTIIFILVIAVLVQLIEITLKRYIPALYRALGVYLPLITTNCCVLGVTILAVQDYSAVVQESGFGMAFAQALVCAAGAGVGFLVAMLLFCGVRQRVENANPPECFKGLPITLVSAAITSLSFMGFGGMVENIINAIL
ncbi:MAG: electron transport complex protein RnfA [Blautia massiliensis (ex Durand et al. 2017)]|nr:MAG: electron transport complex protein RnfA [Subdoligranulum variabile]